jgi:hypothetical protein
MSPPVFKPVALAGFYGPYNFSVRQAERRSENPEKMRNTAQSFAQTPAQSDTR